MRVKFLQDFQGVETGEVFYLRGQVINLPDTQAERLLRDERVALMPAEVPSAAVEAAPEPEPEPAETKSQEAPKARRRKS